MSRVEILKDEKTTRVIITGDEKHLIEKLEFFCTPKETTFTLFWRAQPTENDYATPFFNVFSILLEETQATKAGKKFAPLLPKMGNQFLQITPLLEMHRGDSIHYHDDRMQQFDADEKYPHIHFSSTHEENQFPILLFLDLVENFHQKIFKNEDLLYRMYIVACFDTVLDKDIHPMKNASINKCLGAIKDADARKLIQKVKSTFNSLKDSQLFLPQEAFRNQLLSLQEKMKNQKPSSGKRWVKGTTLIGKGGLNIRTSASPPPSLSILPPISAPTLSAPQKKLTWCQFFTTAAFATAVVTVGVVVVNSFSAS